jgi:hypothetical protein
MYPQQYPPQMQVRPPSGGGAGLKVMTLIGAIIMAGAFGAPWYWARITPVPNEPSDSMKKQNQQEQKAFNREEKEKKDFIEKYKLEDKVEKAATAFRDKYESDEKAAKGKSFSVFVWGWETVGGILCLVFGIVTLVWSILAMAIRALRRWSWIGSFACMGMAIPVVIMAASWWVGCPGAGITGMMSQGSFAGDWAALAGAGFVLIFALIDAIVGLVAMGRGGKPPVVQAY